MIINHNIIAVNTLRQMGVNEGNSTKSLQKLSSGMRINGAADDAAGLAISEKMRAQIRGLDQSTRNAQDGISMIATAEGALSETHSILQRVRELADQSANGTNTADDRKAMQTEVKQLTSEIDRIGNNTEFNTQKLLNGSLASAGGAASGQNTTSGSVVAKLISANTPGVAMSASATAAVFTQEKIKIDGTEIDVKWQDLTTEQQTTIKAGLLSDAAGGNSTLRNEAAALITDTVNKAIDASGTGVAHVKGWSTNAGNFVMQSGSTGATSSIAVSGVASAGVLSTLAVAVPAATWTTVTGSNKYNGATIAPASSYFATVNGVQMSISNTLQFDTTIAMTTVAKDIQTNLNTAITAYNTTANANSGDANYIQQVKVNATVDGRLEVVSQSGPVTFKDNKGSTTVSDLGLSQAQTEAAGSGGMTFQVGANKGQSITFGIKDMRSNALGLANVDVTTAAGAQTALTALDSAIKSVSSERSNLGAIQNRLEHTIANLGTSSENLTAAESRIRDVDMAKEMTAFKKSDILNQASQAMLAQANQQPQGVLQLLR
jgi:flagellin